MPADRTERNRIPRNPSSRGKTAQRNSRRSAPVLRGLSSPLSLFQFIYLISVASPALTLCVREIMGRAAKFAVTARKREKKGDVSRMQSEQTARRVFTIIHKSRLFKNRLCQQRDNFVVFAFARHVFLTTYQIYQRCLR